MDGNILDKGFFMKTRFYCVTVRVYENGKVETAVTSREAALMPLVQHGASKQAAWWKDWFTKKSEAAIYAKAAAECAGKEGFDFNTLSQHIRAKPFKAVAA
jgi:hypothetical protein